MKTVVWHIWIPIITAESKNISGLRCRWHCTVTDILVHLSAKQMEKKGSVVIEGEALDLLVGSQPIDKKEGEKEENPVKAYVLQLLKEQYGIEEKDFVSAELEVVPAGAARDFGLDNSMIMAYGQDDRICAFTSLMGFLHSMPVCG